jgi:hypothetical protein
VSGTKTPSVTPLGISPICVKGPSASLTGADGRKPCRTRAALRPPRRTGPARHTQGHAALIVTLIVLIVLLGLALGTVGHRMKGRRRSSAPDDRSDPDGVFAEAPPEVANGSPVGDVPPSVVVATESDDGDEGVGHAGNVAFKLGVMLYERGHHDEAEAAWRRAVQHRHARAATRLGMALERRGDLDGASQAYLDAERWGDAIGSERAAALHGTFQQNGTPHPR